MELLYTKFYSIEKILSGANYSKIIQNELNAHINLSNAIAISLERFRFDSSLLNKSHRLIRDNARYFIFPQHVYPI